MSSGHAGIRLYLLLNMPANDASSSGTTNHPMNWCTKAYLCTAKLLGFHRSSAPSLTTGRKRSRLYTARSNGPYELGSSTNAFDASKVLLVSVDVPEPSTFSSALGCKK